ncbi:transmembrane protease serine 9 [Drosophila guanche]|uniref:Phenoloxidase-activating factor 2 n=1 Tax=Drosophila guanche TaxID=7266 RepID=A0A3B0JUF3_DROGU|nr:transmembrane protease serine 9 [Drosophila guanche]SPP85745.1 blast:Venom serine protease Bi-VSP [Drosophila guanche]
MFAFLRILLLCVHLLHFKIISGVDLDLQEAFGGAGAAAGAPAVWQNVEIKAAPQAGAALVNATVEQQLGVSVEDPSSPSLDRRQRQLFFDPTLFLLQGGMGGLGGLGAIGGSGGWEGSKCLTTQGQPGACVRISNCRQYYRVARQLTFISLRQWPQQPQQNLGLGGNLCNFFDQLGRINNGICCTDMDANTFGVFPLPSPTTTEKPSPVADEEDKADEPEEQPVNVDQPADAPHPEDPIDNVNSVEDTPDFQDVNTIEANAPEPEPEPEREAEPEVETIPVAATPVYPYQWPFGSFAGGPVAQWPPPLPTHPPTTGGWPPPLPTHPPNHHYPTHPATAGVPRPTTVPSTKRTTPRPAARPTTTKRPTYPSYPVTSTTTRRPVSGSSAEGLPLQCGNKNPVSPDQERIVGGSNASPHEFPWITVLFKSGKQFCGGSLITNNHILTAAHCVARMTSWDVAALTAHLGDYNIRTDFEVQHVSRRIKRLVRHKGFEFSTLHNDVAILTLSEPVPFTHEIQPICLPTTPSQQSRSYSGQVATVAGWGSLRENGPQPSILQKVDIPIWANAECARKYGRAAPGGIIESMICAGQAAKDSCSGDSGGPMIINDGGRYTQVGIVSWGIGCGKGQYPGVYTRVTSLLPWIYKNIK